MKASTIAGSSRADPGAPDQLDGRGLDPGLVGGRHRGHLQQLVHVLGFVAQGSGGDALAERRGRRGQFGAEDGGHGASGGGQDSAGNA
jgi:hypothetical protein